MPAPQSTIILSRAVKRGNVRTFDEEYNKGFTDIWASEVDADFDQLYDAWNYVLGQQRVVIDPTPPLNPNVGDLWWRDTDGNLFVYYDDGNSRQWVPAVSTGQYLGTGLPTGDVPAGGDLTGSYPAPLIAGRKVTGAKIALNTILDENVSSVGWAKLTGIPGLVHVGDAAGGALTGTYPNPGVDYNQITNKPVIPSSFPPSGPAGGDLAGTYPNPTVGALKINNAKISDVNWSKITSVPAAFPPNGPATGDLDGLYPNPVIRVGKGVFNRNSAYNLNQLTLNTNEQIMQELQWSSRGGSFLILAGVHGRYMQAPTLPCGITSVIRVGGTAGTIGGTTVSWQVVGTTGVPGSQTPNGTVPFCVTHGYVSSGQATGPHLVQMTVGMTGQPTAGLNQADSSWIAIMEMA